MSEQMQVEIEIESSTADRAAVQSVLDRHGLAIQAHPGLFRASAQELPWLVLFQAPIGVFLAAFAKNLGSTAADGIRRFVTDLYEDRRKARGDQGGSVGLTDGDLDVLLPADLPLVAFEQLHRLQRYAIETPDQAAKTANWNSELNCWQVAYIDANGHMHRIDITG